MVSSSLWAASSVPFSCTRTSRAALGLYEVATAYVRPSASTTAEWRAPAKSSRVSAAAGAAAAITGNAAPITAMSLRPASGPSGPGAGSVRLAALPAASRIAAPPAAPRDRAFRPA